MNVWRVLGIAGVAGVTATGVIIARDQRQRAQLTPDEVRTRLHERLESLETVAGSPALSSSPSPATSGPARHRRRGRLRRLWPR